MFNKVINYRLIIDSQFIHFFFKSTTVMFSTFNTIERNEVLDGLIPYMPYIIVVVAWIWVCMVVCFWIFRRLAVAFNYHPFLCCLPGGCNAFFGGNKLNSDGSSLLLLSNRNEYEESCDEWL